MRQTRLLSFTILLLLSLSAAVPNSAQTACELEPLGAAIVRNPQDTAAYTKLLNCAQQRQQFPAAIAVLQNVLAQLPNHPTVHHTLAYCYRQAGDEARAIHHWREALRIAPAQQGAALELASTYLRAGEYRQALLALSDHLAAAQDRTSPPRPELVELMIKVVHQYARQANASNRTVEEAEQRALRRVCDSIHKTLSGMYFPVLLSERERYTSINLPVREQLIPLAQLGKLMGEPLAAATLYWVYGLQAGRHQYNPELAAFFFSEALALPEVTQRLPLYFNIAGNWAHTLDLLGRDKEAETEYAKVLTSNERALRQNGLATEEETLLLSSLAKNYHTASDLSWKHGNVLESQRRLYRAEESYMRRPVEKGEIVSFTDRFNLYHTLITRALSLNQVEQARQALQHLLDLTRAQPDLLLIMPEFKMRALALQTQFSLQTKELPAAEKQLSELRQELEEASAFVRAKLSPLLLLAPNFQELKLVAARGEHALAVGKAMAFIEELGAVERQLNLAHREYRVGTFTIAIRAFLAQQRLEGLDKLIEFLEQQLPAVDPYNWKSDALLLKAQYLEQRGDDQQAEAVYRQMADYLSGLRAQMPVADDLYQSEQRLAAAFASYVNFLLQRKQYAEALAVFERARAQTLARTLQLRVATLPQDLSADVAQFQRLAWERFALTKQLAAAAGRPYEPALKQQLERLDADYKAAFERAASAMRLPAQQADLPQLLQAVRQVPGEIVILRLDPAAQTLTTWRVRGGKLLDAQTKSINWTQWQTRLRDFTDIVENQLAVTADGTEYDALGEQLTRDLLPWLAQTPEPVRLTIVPDQHLQELPFAALHLRGRPLIAQKVAALGYAPSLSALAHLHTTFPTPAPRDGLFIGFNGASEGFQALSHTEPDARAMASIFQRAGRSARALTPPQPLDQAALKQAVAGQGLLLLGTHGKLDVKNPLAGYLVLPQQQRLEASALFDWRLTGARFILSACEVGRDVAAENQDILGLTFPLFAAGGRAALHAQWPVEPTITSDLMKTVVTRVAAGQSLEEALVQAQRVYLARTTAPLARHPFYWAAWRVVGKGW